ncbi:MAG: heavy-metal-associated domain-containing protein [Bacteroidaceae bacterium]|jgi:copper chaperone|nr:heavy-metal-associated domain-containing protein [Bacteroidaceae bacterium]
MKWSAVFDKLTGKHADNANEWRYRTSIMCNGCIAKVKPILDSAEGVASWSVNLDTPERILTIVPDGAVEEELLAQLRGAGFTIERI